AKLLRLRDHLQRQGRLARGFRTVNFDDTAARQPADTERDVEHQRSGGNRFDDIDGAISHAHDGAFAELFFDLTQCGGERLALVVIHCGILFGKCIQEACGAAVSRPATASEYPAPYAPAFSGAVVYAAATAA